jgi:hypothetical protein
LYATEILDASNHWTKVKDVVDKQLHLNAHQKSDLLTVLKQNEKMFDRSLGLIDGSRCSLDLPLSQKL